MQTSEGFKCLYFRSKGEVRYGGTRGALVGALWRSQQKVVKSCPGEGRGRIRAGKGRQKARAHPLS